MAEPIDEKRLLPLTYQQLEVDALALYGASSLNFFDWSQLMRALVAALELLESGAEVGVPVPDTFFDYPH